MNSKRLLDDGSKEGFKLPTNSFKRPFLNPMWVDLLFLFLILFSCLQRILSFFITEFSSDIRFFRGEGSDKDLEHLLLGLEPNIRKWVSEEVDNFFQRQSSSHNRIEPSVCRPWQLFFQGVIPNTLFTGNRILTEEREPLKLILCDSITQEILTSGPISSSKVSIVVLDSEFNPDDPDDWGEQKFHRKTVQNREGRKPLVTGELTVQLHEGIGYIGNVSFTDNSSWIRTKKFRLGVKAFAASDRKTIREGISNAFRVKDHRGEANKKHYPPSLNDPVWRLEKIAKDGACRRKLNEFGIYTVRDFLREHFRNKLSVQELLPDMSEKIRQMVLVHALTCQLDEKLYLYHPTAERGLGLSFNSVYKVVGATFDGQNYCSLDQLCANQMESVENLKTEAYDKVNEWILIGDGHYYNEQGSFTGKEPYYSSNEIHGFYDDNQRRMNDSSIGFFDEGNSMGSLLFGDEITGYHD